VGYGGHFEIYNIKDVSLGLVLGLHRGYLVMCYVVKLSLARFCGYHIEMLNACHHELFSSSFDFILNSELCG